MYEFYTSNLTLCRLKFYFVGKISIPQLPKKVDNFIPESFWTIYLIRYQQFYLTLTLEVLVLIIYE